MAHFLNPRNEVAITALEVPKDGTNSIALWGGGPPPAYDDLTMQLTPVGTKGLLGAPFGDDLGDHKHLVTLSGKDVADGALLHAYVTLGGGKTGVDYTPPVTISVFPTVRLSRPPIRKQDIAFSECWAGALSSWCDVAKGNRTKPSMLDLTGKYGIGSDRGIDEQTLVNKLSKDFDYKFERSSSLGPNNLLLTKLASKLKNNGHVLLIYKSGQQSSHSIVVYGVGVQQGAKVASFQYMDPWFGTYREETAEDYYDRALFFAYPA